jgi:hypothetical protein
VQSAFIGGKFCSPITSDVDATGSPGIPVLDFWGRITALSAIPSFFFRCILRGMSV